MPQDIKARFVLFSPGGIENVIENDAIYLSGWDYFVFALFMYMSIGTLLVFKPTRRTCLLSAGTGIIAIFNLFIFLIIPSNIWAVKWYHSVLFLISVLAAYKILAVKLSIWIKSAVIAAYITLCLGFYYFLSFISLG